MLTVNAFLFFMVLLLIAALIEPLVEKISVPFSIILVLLGYVSSEIVTRGFGIDTGIHWENFRPLIVHVILPVLIFQAAMMTDIRSLRNNVIPVFMLALPLLLVSAGIIAAGIYYGISHPDGFPWIAALLTGAILSATDPSAILKLLRKYRTPKRLILILESEGLFNDTTSIVLFSIILSIALIGNGDGSNSWMMAITQFLYVFLGGIAFGALTGLIAYRLIRIHESDYSHALITIISAYISFIIAQDFLDLSGVMSVLATGLSIRILNMKAHPGTPQQFVESFWQLLATVAETLIFLLAGITITLSMFVDQWLAMLIGIAVCLFARILIIYGSFPLFNLVSKESPITFRQQFILTWGGTRGTVTLALALSLPLSLGYWYTIQSIAYGVVLFTLFVQATTMTPLIRKLNVKNAG
jgi:CPA1 family monovalent cation:H+ antiporter